MFVMGFLERSPTEAKRDVIMQIPVKLTTLNRFKLTSEFAGEDFKFMNCFGL